MGARVCARKDAAKISAPKVSRQIVVTRLAFLTDFAPL
jgi:hypothetical protein